MSIPSEVDTAWAFWIDRGGTFTDVVARRPDGLCETRKLLSENPAHYADAATAGIRAVLEAHGETLQSAHIQQVRMGTTVATNALLERRGEPTLLAITQGHADALRIGHQTRPRLFDRNIQLPPPLYAEVAEIRERIDADGNISTPLDEAEARGSLQAAYDQGMRSIAIVLLHAYRYPAHELRLARIAKEIGFSQISVSHEVSALIKLVGRGDTTVADAYLSPLLRRYVQGVQKELGNTPLQFMQSNGGLVDAENFRGRDAVLSGPAGGIVGMARTAEIAGLDRVIGFDMGGTSTDVSHYAGEFERRLETEIAGVKLRTPMMDIHTVAAGGGSVCWFDGMRLRVGPQSAGASPGPACYRAGGPMTITDCNVVLGKIQASLFPKAFGSGADQPIDPDASARRLREIRDAILQAGGEDLSEQQLAEGFIRIAVEHMAQAIKQISIQRGHDVRDYCLVSFGGAAGQHACLVAEALGMRKVMIHPFSGVLSACGMGMAQRSNIQQQTLDIPLDANASDVLAQTRSSLEKQAIASLTLSPQAALSAVTLTRIFLRYAGTDSSLAIEPASISEMRAAFEQKHRARFGFIASDKPIEIEMISVEALDSSHAAAQPQAVGNAACETASSEPERVNCYLHGELQSVPVHHRKNLQTSSVLVGPALVSEDNATTLIEPGWNAHLDTLGNLILDRIADEKPMAADASADPIMREIFNTLFMAVAEQMGETLQQTAHSVNIKERLDFSCAVFDAQGALIANAPHIPVHLGSMGDSVRAVIEGRRKENITVRPGDAWMLNSPYNGGTHLPDITVIAPVFDAQQNCFAYVAARGHHADIGGMTPGSMPPQSKRIDEEGICIHDFQLMKAGELCEEQTRDLLASPPWPARNPDKNLADLRAQLAACARGIKELSKLSERYGSDVVCAYMRHSMDNAEAAVKRVLQDIKPGHFACVMDNGARIEVTIKPDESQERISIDFHGTSEQQHNNFNAPLSVTRAAVLYVIRTLVEDDIPLNDGCLRPVDLIIPQGCMLNPVAPAAVVAGNVETSQIIVDTLYGALDLLAASQGSMNNFTFGNSEHQYYETICGGTGAGPNFDGCSAVHSHMTNSRLTDAEVLESRFPVRVEQFSIRRNSGGSGQFKGGDGVVRKIRFLEPMSAAILSNRRRVAPHGLEGGEPGAIGKNWLEFANGQRRQLDPTVQLELDANDAVMIETPGGGAMKMNRPQ